MQLKSLKEMNVYPGDPHTRVLVDLDIEANGGAQHVTPDPSLLPLASRIRELTDHLRSSADISEFQHIASALGIAPPYILLCKSLNQNSVAEYYGIEGYPYIDGVFPSFIALQVASDGGECGLTPGELVLHELAHEFFLDHDIQFATFLNWQRLRCGMQLLRDPYDVRETGWDAEDPAVDDETSLAVAHALAQAMTAIDLDRAEVVLYIEQAFFEVFGMAGVDAVSHLKKYASGLMQNVSNTTSSK